MTKSRQVALVLLVFVGGCQRKTQLDPLNASLLSLQNALAQNYSMTKIQWEVAPMNTGVFTGYEKNLWRNGANTIELISRDGKVFQVATTFPKPSPNPTAQHKKLAQIVRKNPNDLVNIGVSSEAGAFFVRNAEQALGVTDSRADGPLHDKFMDQAVSVFRNGGSRYTFFEGYVFGCEDQGGGLLRLVLMSESVCRAMGPQACVSTD